MQHRKIESDLRILFKEAVSSVNPKKLIEENIKIERCDGIDHLVVGGKYYNLFMNIFVVGFGKAVLGMARALEDNIHAYIRRGIISVPEGILKSMPNLQSNTNILSQLLVFECAKNNLPDTTAQSSAQDIVDLASGLNEDCLLIVLISGGGSALFPLPVTTISLEEKIVVTKILSNAGANIEELNCVRKRMSQLKGGKLSGIAYPAQVLSLIISDVIGDPSCVASGPTFPCRDGSDLAWEVIKKYNLQTEIPENVIEVLTSEDDVNIQSEFDHVNNVVIGNNGIALRAVEDKARSMNYIPVVLSDKIQGLIQNVCSLYCSLVTNICDLWSSKLNVEQFNAEFERMKKECDLTIKYSDLVELILSSKDSKKPLCAILGGETTVQVTGSGIGGRNQELALTFAIKMNKMRESNPVLSNFEVVLLSAGTDGIDGPTDAAGAIGYSDIIDTAQKQDLDPKSYLENNDSYNFFDRLKNGAKFIKTGHTGTNVMDVHIIVIEERVCHCKLPKDYELTKLR